MVSPDQRIRKMYQTSYPSHFLSKIRSDAGGFLSQRSYDLSYSKLPIIKNTQNKPEQKIEEDMKVGQLTDVSRIYLTRKLIRMANP